MKTSIKYIIPIITLFTLFSCEDWLAVEPKTEIKSSVLFETEQGVKDALLGNYIAMTSNSLYGKELTIGFLDVLAKQYKMSTACMYYRSYKYRYTDVRVKPIIERIWAGNYNVIANLNNIIENLNPDILSDIAYNVVYGEALGLRAFLHFDLLRMYTPSIRSGANNSTIGIPYVTKYNKDVVPQSTVFQVLDKINDDIDKAIEHLEDFDPISPKPKSADYVIPDGDRFFVDRNRRFNYYACKVLKARVLMWQDKYDDAVVVLEEIIDRSGTSWVRESSLTEDDAKDKDLSFSSEHIFALDVNKLFENIEIHIDPAFTTGNMNYDLMYTDQSRMSELFELSGAGGSDFRYVHQMDKSSYQKLFIKYKHVEKYKYENMMALMRRGEINLMLAECYMKANLKKKADAIDVLDDLRKNRGIDEYLSESISDEDLFETITREYRKEFIMEGQLFYYYKRQNFSKLPYSSVSMDNSIYVLPLPEAEIESSGAIQPVVNN